MQVSEVEHYKFQIQELNNELLSLRDFKEMKHRIDDELEKLRQDKEELYKELTLQKNRIEQQYKKHEDELKNRHMMEIRNIEVEALNKARLELSKEDQDLHSENMRLVSDMNLQRGTVEDIKKERKRMRKI